MRYGIILTVDIPRDESIGYYLPPKRLRKRFMLTEGDDQYDYGHLGGPWEKGKHRKLVGELSQEEFDEVVRHCGLRPQDVETLGSLGAPWSFPGIAPAISFRAEYYEAFVEAYVTPLPDIEIENRVGDDEWMERAWERIKKAILKRYQ